MEKNWNLPAPSARLIVKRPPANPCVAAMDSFMLTGEILRWWLSTIFSSSRVTFQDMTDKTNVIDFSMIGALNKSDNVVQLWTREDDLRIPFDSVRKDHQGIHKTFKDSPTKLKRVLYNKALVKRMKTRCRWKSASIRSKLAAAWVAWERCGSTLKSVCEKISCRLGQCVGMTVSPTGTSVNCKRCIFLSFPSCSPCFTRCTIKFWPPPSLLQATCRAGVQLAHSGKCTDLSSIPSCPTSCPEEGKVVPTPFQLFTANPHKRWCAPVTETATGASVKCDDGRAVKGWRLPTTRTAKPQSKQCGWKSDICTYDLALTSFLNLFTADCIKSLM